MRLFCYDTVRKKKVKEAANDQYDNHAMCVSDLDMFHFYVGLTLVSNC